MDEGGANFLEGLELEKTWDDAVKRDLVVLTHEDHEENNALSAWATPKLLSAFHYIFQSVSVLKLQTMLLLTICSCDRPSPLKLETFTITRTRKLSNP